MFSYFFIQLFGAVVALVALIFIVKKYTSLTDIKAIAQKIGVLGAILLIGVGIFIYGEKTHAPNFALPPWMQTYSPSAIKPFLPFKKTAIFLANFKNFAQIEDIGADPNDVPAPITRKHSETVKISVQTREVISEVAPGIFFNFWTFDNQVPGPMMRVREGDMVEMTITNHPSSLHAHNIDLHAVSGTGGGAHLSKVKPGQTRTFKWKATHAGIYVYHCAMANVSTHNSHGQYGMILVEPKEGLPPVDKEFYLMQGELYTMGDIGKKGLTIFDGDALLDGHPNYITFNGIVEQAPRMKIKTGEKIRMYVGNGGVSHISAFHPIGEIFDKVYLEGDLLSEPAKNIQTTAILPGGAAVVEFTANVPGKIILVDHALARMNKGAWAIIEVEGEERPDLYDLIYDSFEDDPASLGHDH